MKFSDENLQSLWQQDTTRASRSDCLSSELLVRAGADDLNATERARLAQHLSGCAECAIEYRIVRTTKEWATQAVVNHPEVFPARVNPEPSNWWQRFIPSFGFRLLAAGLTAALLLLSGGLGWWLLDIRQQNRALLAQLSQKQNEAGEIATLRNRIEELQRPQPTPSPFPQPTALPSPPEQDALKAEIAKLKNELAALTRPQLDVPQIDIDPTNTTRSATDGKNENASVVNVPPTAASFTINLPGAGSKPFPNYLIAILDAKTNKQVWEAQRKQDNETTFTITLNKQGLPAGKYKIRVYGLTAKQKELIADYEATVNYLIAPATSGSKH